jgi:hypothetical protein
MNYRIRNGFIVKDDGTFISTDEEHPDYQEFMRWKAEGNTPIEDTPPQPPVTSTPHSKWEKLAIAFHRSHLYRVRLREATAGAPSEFNDKIWWVDKDLTTVVVSWIGEDENQRTASLYRLLSSLFEVLNEAEFPVSEDDKKEINDALIENGFEALPT